MTLRYDYICIEGNIGSGKTTLSEILARDTRSRLVHESFEENPFLPIFYQDPERHAFPVELHFMAERQKQLQQVFSNLDLFENKVIADYCPQKSLLFAHHTLHPREFKLFRTLYDALFQTLTRPDIILYLHRDLNELLYLIRKRGRLFEQSIHEDYLFKVHQAYQEFFRAQQDIPVLWLNVNGVNFLENREDYLFIAQLLSETYAPGTHYFDLSNAE
jgi:deoxyadenosine/deoxycytidine kinase